ncbi:polymorphic toxin-type HINT domain-containing protein [Streptomyces sp. NPDC058755]|uniref:polymorphic toxin-type HINT domain-containing protein n=1 Tax=Streptomyces sp. NPDC058755 TaxID=3346624 RepID=UPI0036BA10E1
MDTTTQQVARQQYTPYGQPRASANSTTWPDPTHSYLGAPQDSSTGYTDVGARKYDPSLGRFISVDPILEATSPQQLGGYTYAADNPVTSADPSGLESCYPHYCSGDNGTNAPYKPYNDPASPHYEPPQSRTLPPLKHMKDFGDHPPTITQMIGYGTYRADLSPARNVEVYYRERCTSEELLWTSSCQGFQKFYNYWADIKDIPSNPCTLVSLCESLGDLAVGISAAAALEEEAMVEGLCFNSFDPQTPVLMADRKTKPIGKIKPGDRVESGDPETGKHRGPRKVTARLVHHDKDLVDITIRGTDGHDVTLHTTSRHPFWDDTVHAWMPAGKLKSGHVLNTVTNHHVRIDMVIARPGTADMYNLTVDQLHTYYVLASATPVLVHNTCGGDKVWEPFREGVDHTDQGTLPASAGIPAGASLEEGEYHFIVRQDGSLRAMKNEAMWDLNPDAGHTSLGDRKGVLMAGTFDVNADGVISRVDNFSGHYRPTDSPGHTPLLEVTRKAFQGHGWDFSSGAWDYYAGPPGH